MNPLVSDPDLANVGTPGVVDDFLQNVGRRVVAVETQIAVPRARIDQDRVELKAFFEDPDGQIERDAPPAVASQKAVTASIRESGERR